MKYVEVKFMNNDGEFSNKNYAYFTTLEDLEKGDLVVAEAVGFYKVVQVQRYIPYSELATKFVVSKLDLEQAEKDKEEATKREELLRAIEVRMEKAEKLRQAKKLAKLDPELGKLLEQLEEM